MKPLLRSSLKNFFSVFSFFFGIFQDFSFYDVFFLLKNVYFDFCRCRFYATQKKTLELNPGHPIVKDLLRRVEADQDDEVAKDLALVLYESSAIRSGFAVPDTVGFFDRVEKMLRRGLDISLDEKVEEYDELSESAEEIASHIDDKELDAEPDEGPEVPPMKLSKVSMKDGEVVHEEL